MKRITIIPIMGEKIIVSVIPKEIRSSIMEKIGLINPAVKTEDIPLRLIVVNWNPPVIKTPLVTDNIHCNPGEKSLKHEAESIVPAMIEVGVANISNKLSTQGIKFPKISIIAAKKSTEITQSLPIQFQLVSSWTNSALYNKPYKRGGINILNPQAADRPIAKIIETNRV